MSAETETGGTGSGGAEEPERAIARPKAVSSAERGAAWRTNFGLFLATVGSVFLTGILLYNEVPEAKNAGTLHGLWLSLSRQTPSSLLQGAQFTASLLTILVAHELGHYIAARFHKVDASLPYFIPMPVLSPFGTMGAVIRMRGVIPTRRALLDIGASGPLAGLVFALPLYAWGVAHSKVVPIGGEEMLELGESVMIRGLDRLFGPPVGEGMTAVYSPVAYGAWGGMFVTMINLLPVGQLDGGHVAYALFGPKQDGYARQIHRALLAFFGVIIVGHVGRDLNAGRAITATLMGRHVANAVFWLVWFQLLAVLGSLAARANRARQDALEYEPSEEKAPASALPIRTRLIATIGLVILSSMWREHASWLVGGGFFIGLGLLVAMEIKGGVLRSHDLLDHPPTSAAGLDLGRKVVAIVTLVIFALLFMPEPFSL
jgi:membrane-associated protease RseP (regulator of RpoE activity)